MMASEQPFQLLFETFGRLPVTHAEMVNQEAARRMRELLAVPVEQEGRFILLKAPRAGHGKTHLLSRLQHEFGSSHEFVPVHAAGGNRIEAMTLLDDVLRRLSRGLPAAGGLTVLDLVARRLFSQALQPLVLSGEVPCQDREGALTALRTRPIETFDFHHPSAVTAHWARENFELLGPRLSLELSQRHGVALREASFWVDALFRFSATAINNPGRVRALGVTVFDDPLADGAAHERVGALLSLLATMLRVVLVLDELEGFSADETSALKLASLLGSLRQSVGRLDVVLSVNQDVWESAFLPRLSGGLADRLSEVVVELQALGREEKIALIEARSPGYGEKILGKLDSGADANHARGLFRAAALAWNSKDQGAEFPVVKPVEEPTPMTAEAPPLDPPRPALEPEPFAFVGRPDQNEIFTSTPFAVAEDEPVVVPPKSSEPLAEEETNDFSAAPEPPPVGQAPAFWPKPEVSAAPFDAAPEPLEESVLEAPVENPVVETAAPFAVDPPPLPAAEAPFMKPEESFAPPTEELMEPPALLAQELEEPLAPPVHELEEPLAPLVHELEEPPASTEQKSEVQMEEKATGTDRVDDLLRQFRERYGKGAM